ncbi:helicase-related protein [Dysgonomonas capnocytophagoides]|uniref:helicase-related protein n=1 Tax=Dysgonomonas capnocytophagoides TaxID=45254 RepID=UPI0039937A08
MTNTKFFTNEKDNTLLNKIEGIFQHRNIHFFDALVGYFRASGYFRIRKFIKETEEIRILVGINIDNLVFEANQQGVLFDPNKERSQEDFFLDVKKNIQDAKYDKTVEEGMYQLIEDITTRKVKIRVHPKQNIHAKIYIFREKEKHDHGYGAVITGSSNLTDYGLSRNFEFNVELRDNSDIDFATNTFDKLWDEGVEVRQEYIDRLKKETFLNDEFTPYEVYLKFLVEYFGKSIEFDPNSISDLPKGFKKLSYQADAVVDGFSKMMKYNGFFLADVVGLGKTIVAALIAKRFFFSNNFPSYRSKTLIITPPALKDNWIETLEKFNLDNFKVITNGSLHKVNNPDKYDLIIVDEAHKFRSDTAEMYNQLQKICKTKTRQQLNDGTFADKKVILISATPLNNKPEDIANLVYLFQNSKDSNLNIGNLQHFFRIQTDRYKKLKDEPNSQTISKEIKEIYKEIRDKVIKPLTVRRTRTDLIENEAYKIDLKNQNIHFPNLSKPEKIFYQLDKDLDTLYDKTIFYLSHPTKGLTYNRYQAIRYLKPYKKIKYQKADMISTQLAKIMKTLLVKRIDSSFHAFKNSLKRFSVANKAMLTMFEQERIFIAPNIKVNEYINEGREEELMELVLDRMDFDPTIEICEPNDFEAGFLSGLQQDQYILEELIEAWDKITYDPKLDIFIEYLKNKLFDNKINREGKLVIFSESKETTNYLYENLQQKGFDKLLSVESSNRKDKMPMIRENFDANYEGTQKNDYNIVISTEVLAEGVNMHRANIIVNYDTPWNSTRLMQRIGRVNRIGTQAKEVHIFNFFPTAKVNKDIDLEKKAKMKLIAFHAALGEDSQIYSPDEEPETFGLFDKDLDEERDESLRLLMDLRKIKAEDPSLIKKIQNMPLRARSGRKNKALKGTTLIFIRNDKRETFSYIREDGTIDDTLSFLEAVDIFHARIDEKGIPLHDLHHLQVSKAIDLFSEKEEADKAREKKIDTKQGPSEKRALAYLDGFIRISEITDTEKKLILKAKQAIAIGKFQNLRRDINKLETTVRKVPVKTAILLEKLIGILNQYPLNTDEDEIIAQNKDQLVKRKLLNPQIIISESFNTL